jgi:hypothetical protein
LFLTAGLFLLSGLANHAAAVTINFDDGTAGLPVGNFYAGLGVTFSANTLWDGFVSPDEGLVGAGGLKIQANNYQPTPNNPIVATFNAPLSHFQILGLNVGANGARIDAYDAVVGGNLIASDQAFGVDVGANNHPLLVTSVAPIRRVHMYQPQNVTLEGLLFDNMSFRVIPEPSTLLSGMLALCGLAGARRRRT